MSIIDELERDLRRSLNWASIDATANTPDYVLAAALRGSPYLDGYRKPRTITTAEELDALPTKSAILDRNGTPWVGDGDKVEPWASVCEDPYGGPIWKNSVDIALPVTVLHDPAVTS